MLRLALVLLPSLALAQSVGPDPAKIRLKDEGVTRGYVHTLNFTGSGVTCTVANGAAACDVTGGGGGSPGGSGAELQYRSGASSFGAVANVIHAGGDLNLLPRSTFPSAPSSGIVPFAHAPVGGAAPSMFLSTLDSATGLPLGLFPFMGAGRPIWGALVPNGGSLGTLLAHGMIAKSDQGTCAAPTAGWATTSLVTRTQRTQCTSTAAVNSLAGTRQSVGGGFIWRGNAAGAGGFQFWGSWNMSTPQTGMRLQVGLVATGLSASAEPSASTNAVYFGCDSSDTNIKICSNDNTGAATCSTLGASFPCANSAAFYNAYLWAKPNDTAIGYAIERLDTPATASGSLTSDLPVSTTPMIPQVLSDTGTSSSAVVIQIPGLAYIANP